MAIVTETLERGGPTATGRRIRVAQIVTKFTTGGGGMALEGALALDPARFETTILAAAGGSLTAAAASAGVRLVPLRHMAPEISPIEDGRGVREIAAHLEAGGYDVVHTHSAKAGGVGRVAAHRAGARAVIHTFHGFPFHEFQPAPRRHAYIAMERRLARITDYFLAAGTMIASEAVRLRIAPPERIRAFATVPVGEPVVEVSPAARAQARRAMGLPADAVVIGTAARLDFQKAPLDMVEAVAALGRDDVHVAWIGDGELREETERAIRRRRLEARFLLLGHRQDVGRLLPGLDVFAMSSLYEGLPCAVVEAMTSGVPVVATAVPSVPEIVIAGKTGVLARPGDPASLARALAFVLDHPAEGARMARAARELVGGRFRRDALGRDLAEAYETALTLARGGARDA